VTVHGERLHGRLHGGSHAKSGAPRERKMQVVDAFFEKLGRVQPLWYLVIYVLCIPVFALIYCSLDGGFYGPYAKMERAGESDAATVTEILLRALQGRFTSTDRRSTAFDISWLEPISGNGRYLVYRVDGSLLRDQSLVTFVRFSVTVTGRPDPTDDRPQVQITYNYDAKIDGDSKDIQELIGQRITAGFSQDGHANGESWKLDSADTNSVVNFIAGYAGDPNGISQSFLRMTYFSVIVITTVGFGDIVPMTPAARACVAIEAISGIILAGLFINALSYRASGRPSA
jgi:hypothetical protein